MRKNGLPSWLRNAVFYQVYPQSFRDSNGDGIGDIPGIMEQLDYLQWLGVNALWINPCFVSPFQDAGYDVADYYRVAPRYGTNRDLRRLFSAAHRRGLRVCLDLVPGHTSIAHPWFRASARHEATAFRDRYIWTSTVWESVPRMNFVLGAAERDGNYLTNFFWFQPALNYGFGRRDPKYAWQVAPEHPAARATLAEMVKVMRFWLDQGADGFRVDMAGSLVKDDPERRATARIWRRVRAMFDRDYPEAALIAEWSHPIQAIGAGFHVDFLIQFGEPGYNALFLDEDSYFTPDARGDIRRFLDNYLRHYRRTRAHGLIAVPTGNHDMVRLSHGRTPEDLKVAMAFFLTLPGVPFLYYGDEIGLRYQEGLPSKEGGYNRTGSRTPMQWDTSRNAGFSSAPRARLYLPIDPEAKRPTVSVQQRVPDSLLAHVRRLIALRRAEPALAGDTGFRPVASGPRGYPFVFERGSGAHRVWVAVNPGRKPVAIRLALPRPPALDALCAQGVEVERTRSGVTLSMAGRSFGIWRRR